ncbi:MAG: DUF6516 family protein [Parazoarcus communis]
MKATLISEFKDVSEDGSIIQMIVWRVPVPVPPTEHGFKYRLVYVVDGIRLVGFDNERGKGDYCHLDGKESSYRFSTVDQLIEDFIKEVNERRMR